MVAASLYREIGTPLALEALRKLKAKDYEGLATMGLDPKGYTEGSLLKKDLQAVDFLRKFPGLPGWTEKRRVEAAVEKGLGAEHQCQATNQRLTNWYVTGVALPIPRVDAIFSMAQQKIRYVLGEWDEDELTNLIRWGPGGSSRCKNPKVSPYHKFTAEPQFTRRAARFASRVLSDDAYWAADILRREPEGPFTPWNPDVLTPGNRVTTAPKTAVTHRLIAVEPHWNILFQLGVGQMLRRRLKRRAGIDLDSQERNQALATHASIMDDLATIDLSNASDTVSYGLVRALLTEVPSPGGELSPDSTDRWFDVMSSLRSVSSFWPKTEQSVGGWRVNSKFSSMGNGFTFELESLIFWAFAQSCEEACQTGNQAAVYGDDIIVHKGSVELLTQVLEAFGFSLNSKKSFVAGSFRESCGVNSFRGEDVTPFRLTDFQNLSDIYTLHNGLKARGYDDTCRLILGWIPEELKLYGPSTAGDSVLHEDQDFYLWQAEAYGVEDAWFFWGLRLKALVFEPRWVPTQHLQPACMASWYSLPKGDPITTLLQGGSLSEPPSGTATLRGRGVWRVGSVLVDSSRVHKSKEWLIAALLPS